MKQLGLLLRSFHHCERRRGRASELRWLLPLLLRHDRLRLPGHCGMDLGIWMACVTQQRGLHGLVLVRVLLSFVRVEQCCP